MRKLTKEEAKGIDVDFVYNEGNYVAIIGKNEEAKNIVWKGLICKKCGEKRLTNEIQEVKKE